MDWLKGIYHIWLGYMVGVFVMVIPIIIMSMYYNVPGDILSTVFLIMAIPGWLLCRCIHKHYGVKLC